MMDAATSLVVVFVAVVSALGTAPYLRLWWLRRTTGSPAYGPGLLGVSKYSLSEPDRDSCYMCGRSMRGWQPLAVTCPECKVRYAYCCRELIVTDDRFGGEGDPKEYECRYCFHIFDGYFILNIH